MKQVPVIEEVVDTSTGEVQSVEETVVEPEKKKKPEVRPEAVYPAPPSRLEESDFVMAKGGGKYYKASARVAWFRENHPYWTIETEVLQTGQQGNLVKATIINDKTGLVVATAHKFSKASSDDNALTKTETGAVSRAITLCGFARPDDEELEEFDDLIQQPQAQSQTQPRQTRTPARTQGYSRYNRNANTEEVGY